MQAERNLNFEVRKHKGNRLTIAAMIGDAPLDVQTIDVTNSKQRANFIDDLKKLSPCIDFAEASKELVALANDYIREARENTDSDPASDKNRPLNKSKHALETTDREIRAAARTLLRSPNLIQDIIKHVHALGVAGEDDLVVALYLIGTSRLLAKPLAGIVMGPSSAGKSHIINTVAKLFPEETLLQAHRMTPRALEHMAPGELVNRFVVGGERSRLQDDAAAEATRALREMISDGNLSVAMPVKGPTGEWQTVHIKQDGPIAHVESTTLGIKDIFDEDRTRCLPLTSDETEEQTGAVIQRLADDASLPADPDISDSILALHHAVQRMLIPRDVQVPFADQLIKCLPPHRLEVRRTFGHLLSLIKAVALLHQRQRKRNDRGQIIATVEDYQVVREHFAEPLARSLGQALTPGAKSLLKVAQDIEQFTVTDLLVSVPFSKNTIRSRVKELVAAGQLEIVEESRGRSPAKYKVVSEPPPLHGLMLPDLAVTPEVGGAAPSGDTLETTLNSP